MTKEQRANNLFCNKDGYVRNMADDYKRIGYIQGATEQEEIDNVRYNKLRKLAMDMYTAMQYLSTDTRSIREKMNKFHHYIIYEEKAMEE